ncbi:MAG: prephenate dehydratase [Vampirovibrionales bacterium]
MSSSLSSSSSPSSVYSTEPYCIGYLGPAFTNSHNAALRLLELLTLPSEHITLQAFASLPLLLEACEQHRVHAIVAPYENALEGTVIDTLDALANQARGMIVHAEWTLPILHGLIGTLPDLDPSRIHTVYSHPMALGQCRQTLRQLFGTGVHLVPTLSTTEAVDQLLALPLPQQHQSVAIAPPRTAERYQLPCYRSNVSDITENETRFLLMTHHKQALPVGLASLPATLPVKSSLCVKLPEYPGVLKEYLSVFHRYWVNLTKIESRPTRGKIGEYRFFFECEGNLHTLAEGKLYQELKARSRYFHAQAPIVLLDALHATPPSADASLTAVQPMLGYD